MTTWTDLFAGAGGSSTGIVANGGHVRYAANHWDLAVEVHNANHPMTDHICADISQYDPRRIARTDCLWASPECFTAGHLVTTARGQVPIELVEVGDTVLTHRGRWRRVVRVQARESSDLVLVKGQGHPGIITTAKHRFWARPSDLTWHNEVRQYRRAYQSPDWIEAKSLVASSALWATPVAGDRIPTLDLPPVFAQSTIGWWLLGRWLGDGSLSFGRNHEVTITCGFHEAAYLAAALGTTGVRWHRSEKRTAVVFTASCVESRDWLAEHCGHGAANKQVPTWALSLDEPDRRSILHGYMSADGGTSQRRHRASTVSRALAVSMRMLAESLAHRVAMAHDKRTTYTIEGRHGVAKRQWIIHWEPVLSDKRSPEAFATTLHSWSRVRSVEAVAGTQMVYNIEVAEDHSYVLDGIVVANCTNHSRAKGRRRLDARQPDLFGEVLPDAAAERSRATMWDVVRFTEAHRYRAIFVENVVEATQWEPFEAWLLAMRSLGYLHRIVSLNSMHAQTGGLPAPQSRDRIYVVFWRATDRAPDLEQALRPNAWCPRCDAVVESRQAWKPGRSVGRYRQQYVYVCPNDGATVEPGWLPAAAAIDWSLPGQRIGDRTKPLADKTRARIAAGIARYWAPIHLEAAGHTYDAADPAHKAHGDPNGYYRAWSVAEALKTLHTIESKALCVPLEGRAGDRVTSTGDPLRTQTSRHLDALVTPVGGTWTDRSIDPSRDPLATQTTNDGSALVTPFIAELRGGGSDARPVTHPAATFCASGNHHALLAPYYGASETARPTSDPIGTLTTVDRYALIHRHNSGGAEMLTPASEVMRTLTTAGHQSVTPGDLEAAAAQVDDCLFRMLEPHEVAAGMAFPGDYDWRGTRRERVKMAGNAVTPPAARDLVAAVVEGLG